MENPFSLSDDALKNLLKAFKNWFNENDEERKYSEDQRKIREDLKETFLNEEYISNKPDEELIQELFKYPQKLEGPVGIKLGIPRISDELSNIKRNILYLINSPDDPLKKAGRILKGDYQIPFFSKAFWSPMFQAQYPEDLPNWNNKTDDFFKNIGVNLTTSTLSIEEKYRILSDSFLYLKNLDPELDYYAINHLMHYGTFIDEGNELIEKLKNIDGTFHGFTEETFKILQKLFDDTRYEVVKPISQNIHKKAIHPLGALFKDIALKFDQKNILNLEKEKHVTAKLFKTNPKSGAWPYVWGAFYQKGEKRHQSMQFFIWMNKDSLTYGIYPSVNKPEVKLKIIENLKEYGEQLNKYIMNDFFKKYTFYTDYSEGKSRDFFKVNNYKELSEFYEKYELNVGGVLKPEEVTNKGKGLVDFIRKRFEGLVPLYTFGISDNPVELLQLYYGDVEPTKLFPKEEILKEIFMEESKFDQIVNLIENTKKKQIILQGPPGTGKTFIAKKIAQYLAQSEKRIETIQFHPSYSYEDFIEGYRPSDDDGFELRPGIFKLFCKNAKDAPNQNFVMVIDEINRGNLSKIFGELLYLLEYRDQKVMLTYSSEMFSIPNNLYIIGTMNTADRSLAIMDYALRRRFYFVDLKCQTKRLGEWLKESGSNLDVDDLMERIANLNQKIAVEMQSEDFAIGHSYFMRETLDENSLNEIIHYEIRPLLEEYFFDKREKTDRIIKTLNKNES